MKKGNSESDAEVNEINLADVMENKKKEKE